MPPSTAVIPAAGRGTRLAPLTRAVPKELLPLARIPVLEHVVRELADTGVGRIVVVVSPEKAGLAAYLHGLGELPATVETVLQPQPRGLGDAVACAAALVPQGEPFVVALGDAVVGPRTLRALLDAVEAGADGAIAFEHVAPELTSRYGIADIGEGGMLRAVVEKPAPGSAPSDLAIAARYVLPHAVLGALAETPAGAGGEIQLTDAIAAVIAGGARIAAVEVADGERRLDVGSHAGYAAAFVTAALRDPELAGAVHAAYADAGDR